MVGRVLSGVKAHLVKTPANFIQRRLDNLAGGGFTGSEMLLDFSGRKFLCVELTDEIENAGPAPDEKRGLGAGLPIDGTLDFVLPCGNNDVINQAAQDLLPL